ncbi:MAG: hypothetical protein BWY83_01463 [bacterium ADurb.Bin478]|nr:MAG: hypothetical protein BWY83_01463 [bacterium ADurb.Bin478]
MADYSINGQAITLSLTAAQNRRQSRGVRLALFRQQKLPGYLSAKTLIPWVESHTFNNMDQWPSPLLTLPAPNTGDAETGSPIPQDGHNRCRQKRKGSFDEKNARFGSCNFLSGSDQLRRDGGDPSAARLCGVGRRSHDGRDHRRIKRGVGGRSDQLYGSGLENRRLQSEQRNKDSLSPGSDQDEEYARQSRFFQSGD